MKNLAQTMSQRAESNPDHIAVIDETGAHRLGDIVAAARRTADALAAHTVAAPTAIVAADNTWQTLASVIAVGLRGGLVAVISPHATAGEFALGMEDIDPDIVIAPETVIEHWGLDVAHFPNVLAGFGDRTVRAANVFGAIDRWGDGSAIAMTSGSTGRPKCVVQSESAMSYAAQSTIDVVGLTAGDRVGAFVPLSSVAAFCFGMYLPAHLGGTMVCVPRWSPAAGIEAMRSHGVKWTMLVPTMALQLSVDGSVDGIDAPLSGMRAMTVGGGPMNVRALQEAEERLGVPFLRVFGMSECLGHTTPAINDPAELRLGRDGKPFPGTVVRAVNESGSVQPAGEIGDAQVKGPSLFVGYARGGVPQPPELTEDGFLPTGDLVEVGADGFIQVMGRQKQIIIRGGRNIDINEVEGAIADVPGVVQVCVVPVPDDMLGERAAALVVSADTEMSLEAVTAHLDKVGFPKFKWPEYLFAVDDLPQNRVGKLSRPDAVSLAVRLAGSD